MTDFLYGLLIGMILTLVILEILAKIDNTPKDLFIPVYITSGNSTVVIRTLPPDKLRCLAIMINSGRPFRYKNLVGYKRLLKRSEWDSFTSEAVKRGLLERGKNKVYSPTPLGIEFFKTYPLTHAHSISSVSGRIKGYFD